ncbi:protein translocase subunit SecD [Polymorphobacter fuscus]|uniref:Protein translocase subunit SecD n=1 Tax=Sandarakinorhabdus fusca TaxID=1439888 RepID=A0A7C9GN25_9SPHN|nr:protein translocase subunit SecD [Polymorphobacter fuscus]KAB7648381.1 protein translocase subunit SecD [Polymorphobacter fuscus]MQT15896.1 protein translocase subunit SecD [Polymorphobacter fuscus]NJC07831.1 preprotein translocase subunit SecD [Polymorphobacter fuscus]
MLDFPQWKVWSIWATIAIGFLFAFPNFLTPEQAARLPAFLPSNQLSLGLDLRGGSHLMLEASTDDVRKTKLESLEDTVRAELRQASGGAIAFTDMSTAGGRLSLVISDPSRVDAAVETLKTVTRPLSGLTGARDVDVTVEAGNRIILTESDAGVASSIDSAMAQAVEVIRKRIDELGTREPTIVRQGANRIVVQVPGLQDPQALKALLGKTAKLEFKLVDVAADPTEVAQGRAPPGSQILPSLDGGPVVVKRRAIITGDQLIDSQVSQDQNGQPAVSFRFDSTGGRRFAQATQENVGRPFAIILDNKVISAPNITEPILGGSGIISGSYTVQTANELAILLRSGKLPVELKVVEERTVGPDLGADSIRAGSIAAIVAVIAVSVLMIVTYGRFGVYAVFALVINVMLILAVMSGAGFTLTLPGIAGLVLTIGAAVDANVLINERIREEQRKGRGVIASVEVGFRDATRTIWDANSLNIIVAIIMFIFGSGPIKGFAVVLSIGIATSVFTAVTLVRLIVSRWLARARPAVLVI